MKKSIFVFSIVTSASSVLNAQVNDQLTIQDIEKINRLLQKKVLVLGENDQLNLADQLKKEDLIEILEVSNDFSTNCGDGGMK